MTKPKPDARKTETLPTPEQVAAVCKRFIRSGEPLSQRKIANSLRRSHMIFRSPELKKVLEHYKDIAKLPPNLHASREPPMTVWFDPAVATWTEATRQQKKDAAENQRHRWGNG
jgi:hypothetical protein